MRLTFRQKEQFFHEIEQSLRSGLGLPKIIERLSQGRQGPLQKLAAAMKTGARDSAARGFFEPLGSTFSGLDLAVIASGEAGGRLEQSAGYLSEHYAALSAARSKMWAQLAYPLFVLHFGAIALAVPAGLQGGISGFLSSAISFLAVFYVLIPIGCLLVKWAIAAAARNASWDRILQRLPVIGSLRVALVSSRFCLVMELLVKAGSSILSAIEQAANASGSALFVNGAEKCVHAVRNNGELARSIADTRAFPESIDRAFQTGAESGRLPQEMERQRERFSQQYQSRLEGLVAWAPRIFYLLVALAVGWKVVGFYAAYYNQIDQVLRLE